MTQTLRREMRTKLIAVLESCGVSSHDPAVTNEDMWRTGIAELLADAALELRAFKTPTARIDRTDQEWDELGDKKMTAMIESAQEGGKVTDALVMFEKAIGVGKWPWDTTDTWQRFAKFVRKIHESSPTAFGDYVVWRTDPKGGKYDGYSNKKIRDNPQAFMDTGWPEFEATRKPSNLQIHTDENGIPETY